MPSLRLLALALLSLPLVLASPVAHAQAGSCETELSVLEQVIRDAPSLDGTKTETSLLGKVADARAKLLAGKPADAAEKLTDILQSLDRLSADKISSTDAANIRSATNAALQCVIAIS